VASYASVQHVIDPNCNFLAAVRHIALFIRHAFTPFELPFLCSGARMCHALVNSVMGTAIPVWAEDPEGYNHPAGQAD
jgi:hypothetical protein